MANRGRLNMSLNSTNSVSTAFLASGSKVESVQSKLDRNCFRESTSSSGFKCSSFLAPVNPGE